MYLKTSLCRNRKRIKMRNDKDAGFWIRHLRLEPHPEGGYFREVYRSDESVSAIALPERFPDSRNFSTSIYYLLNSGEFSSFHRIKSDEIWHFYDGSEILIHMISPGGDYKRILLGRNAEEGSYLQYAIPFGCWFSAEVKDTDAYALAGCTVAPGFNFADFEMGSKEKLLQLFPHNSEIISRLTR